MTTRAQDAGWEVIVSQLPPDFRELAVEMGLVRRLPPHIGQKVLDIGIALRLILHYAAQRGSMRLTTAMAATAGIVSISQPALFKWMAKIGPYLEALVARTVEKGVYASEKWGGYELIVADASTVERPGAKGTTARLHYAMRLGDLSSRFIKVTDETIGEKMRNFDVQPNELWIVDRGYSNPPSVLDTVDAGGAIIVRVNRYSLPMYDALDNRVDIPALLANTRRRGEAHESTVTIKTNDGRQTAARLCWLWLPKPEAEKARARAMRDGAKADEELDSSEYIVLLTTAPQMRLRVDQTFELYRARWQIELNFKRDKSIGQLDRLPSMTPATIHAWICANVLLGLIARRLSAQSVDLPPCGIAGVLIPLTEEASVPSARPRRSALVRHAVGVESDSRRAAALHAS